MQLTIDSSQPLEDVLRVIGAMYKVDISAGPTNAKTTSRTTSRRTAPQRRNASANARRNGKHEAPTSAQVRAWAVSKGYEVGSKGRIPDSVVAAYRASNA
jgi:hypothetical protein